MATKQGLVQVKDLIKQGKLTETKCYKQGFITKKGDVGICTLELYKNRVYLYAQKLRSELPCTNHRITRTTTIREIFNEIENK